MMTIEDIKELIANDEHRMLELKKTTGELKDAMHTACAFLNTEGGWLVFGITPISLKIIGQEVSDNTQQEIANALAGLDPAVNISVEYIDIPDKPGYQVIAMHFDNYVWGKHPYTYHGCPYYRIESTTKQMPTSMYDDRLRASKPQFFAWEQQPADRIGADDLHAQRLRGAIKLGVERGRISPTAQTEPFNVLLNKLRLLTEDGRPNNAAAALFGTNIAAYPQFKLRMSRFLGTSKNEFVDIQEAEGNFFDLLDAGMAFFFKWLAMSAKIVGLKREERLEIPYEALREALTNCLCHRQFEKYNLTPSIAIYDDRVEIDNPGVLPQAIPVQSIKSSHQSFPYNPIIADVLYKTTFLERWGSGIDRILKACHENNVEEPEWSFDGAFVRVTFKRQMVINDQKNDQINIQDDQKNDQIKKKVKELYNSKIAKRNEKNDQINDQIKGQDDQINDQINIQDDQINEQKGPSDRQKLLLDMVRGNPSMTFVEMAKKIGYSTSTIQREFVALSKLGINVVRVGSNKTGYWVISETNK